MYRSDLVQNTETMQHCNLLEQGVTAQAMSHQFLTTKAWVHSQRYGTPNKQSCTGRLFSQYCSFFISVLMTLMLHTHSCCTQRMD